GALYKTGKEAQAGEIFAEMGDSESLMTQFYKKRSYLAISQHYRQNPNSKVLPFLLQDFVNNVQEAIDLQNDTYGGKLFIRDINKEEAWQMMQFCELVVREGKTETPIMWKSAKAWMEFLYGKKKEATQDILAASSLAGTDRMKDCTRELILYITASQAKPSQTFDDYLADELAWLKGRKDGQAYRVINRLTHQALFEHYAADASRKGALMEFANCYVHDYLDTLQVEKVEQYLTYRTTPATNKLDQLLKEQEQSENFTQEMYDLIGTKYMRLCQWGKAISWLKQVPDNFYNTRGYRIYAALRSYQVEPWMKRQWLSEDVMNSSQDRRVWKHPKLNFAREVQMMEGSLHLLSGKALEQRCYNLAVRYAQANFRGDCWWLMRDAWSVTDTVRVHETNLAAKAVELLQKAAVSTDFDLKTKALFALGYCELYSKNFWREKIWDTALGDFVDRYNPQSPQFRAYKALFDLLKDEPEEASYIGNCDEFDVFRSYCRSH
nr:hypothetical protein [Bacteroidaceae bacterium]